MRGQLPNAPEIQNGKKRMVAFNTSVIKLILGLCHPSMEGGLTAPSSLWIPFFGVEFDFVKYIGYYDVDSSGRERRSLSLAARNKMNYIAETISKFEPVEIISPSGVTGRNSDCGRIEKITDRVFLRLFPSLGKKNAFIGKVGTVLTMLSFLSHLAIHIQKGETVIVYHSLAYCKPLYYLKRVKSFRLILEVEEIYGDVIGDVKAKKWELRLAKQADGYIFPTQLLSHLLNTEKKPELIIHGTYRVEPDRKCNIFGEHLHEGKNKIIHVVYAGTLDPRKGGAVAAAAAAEFLPENYYIHILGFGSDQEIQNMKDLVADIASRSKAKVSYDGLLSGEDYIRFIQSCDIGLSTQNPEAAFNATSFPSKILSYMANGLRVVSIRIPAIELSAIGDQLYYYDQQTPEEIAKAIQSVSMESEFDSRTCIQDLDKKFCVEMGDLLR